MEMTVGVCLAWMFGVAPLVGWLLWWWNDIRYGFSAKVRCSAGGTTKLPPGHMGLPLFGEMLTFLWYFKVVRRPDDYINSKQQKYGDGVGMYRTHLFGSPAIIAYTPSINKFILQSESNFKLEWPSVEIVGTNSLVAVEGASHSRLRGFVSRAINQPDALHRVALMVQPRVAAALQSWSRKGRIIAFKEAKKVTFENIGKFFASFEPGPLLDNLDDLFEGLLNGIRAYPVNFPGSSYHYARQCRKKAVAIFREQMEKKRKNKRDGSEATNDLMDGLMNFKDDEGKNLSEIEVLDNIVSLVVAGYKSTALGIMWTLHYLAKYNHVLQKLREENMLLSKTKDGEYITYEDILKLKYTNKVVEETIRLANVAAIVFRTAIKDVEYKGHKIPKGWKAICWLRYLHTDAENFEDPMCFNPERWNEMAKPGTYQVFGGGSRICAGNMLARLQLAIILHHLAVGYKWELVNPNAEMRYLSHPMPVDGVEVVFSKL